MAEGISTIGAELLATTNATDYTRSFIQFTVDRWDNTPRTAVDAVCTLITPDGDVRRYVLGNACIGENMYVAKGLIQTPATEFLQIVSDERFTYLKDAGGACRDIRASQVVGQRLPSHDGKGVTLMKIEVDLVDHAHVTPITTHEQVRDAMLGNRVINARTSYVEPDGTRVRLDYQVRTCNVSGETGQWQVDTGRVLALSSPTRDGSDLANRLVPAYIVYNDWQYAEVAAQRSFAEEGIAARYDDVRCLSVTNELFIVDR